MRPQKEDVMIETATNIKRPDKEQLKVVNRKVAQLNIPDSPLPRVVIIGAGFGGINLVKKLKNKPFQVVLINKTNYHLFQPLMYQVATAGLEASSIAFPVRGIFAHKKDFYFRLAEVQKVDAEKNYVETNIGHLNYDYLVIGTGSKANYFGNDNFRTHAKGMKTLYQAIGLRNFGLKGLEDTLLLKDSKEKQVALNIVIAGGGPTGVELAGALAEFKKKIFPKDYPELSPDLMSIHLIEGAPRLLSAMSDKASESTLKHLKKMGVKVKLNTLVKDYDGTKVTLADDSVLYSKYFIWSAGVQGNAPCGLPEEGLVRGNRIKVNDFNLMFGSDNIFAIGDVAQIATDSDRPKGHPMLAQPAIQQGQLLAENLQRIENKQEPQAFKYWDKGSMATIGKNKAVVDIGNIHLTGFVAWVIWIFVHLAFLMGFRNKVIVFFNWIYNYITFDRATRILLKRQ